MAARSTATILVLSAEQTFSSAMRVIEATQPCWIVVAREISWEASLLLYAYMPQEMLALPLPVGEPSLNEALGLREIDSSNTEDAAGQRRTNPTPSGAPPSRRLIRLDAEERVVEVVEHPLGAVRGNPPAFALESATTTLRGATPTRELLPDTVDVRLATRAPKALSVGTDDLIEVRIWVAAEAPLIPDALAASVSPAEPIAALLTLMGDAVVAVGPRVLRLKPPKPGVPSQNAFEIRAIASGVAQLAVVFRQGGSELGCLRHTILVSTGPIARGQVPEMITAAPRVADDRGVLFLQIDPLRSGNDIRYRYRVQFQPLQLDFTEYESPKLLDDNGTAANSELEFVRRIYANMTKTVLRTPEQVRRFSQEVAAFAEDLGRQLFPDALRQVLWQARGQIDSIRVMSWEPYIPWELVKLTNPANPAESDDRFLGEYGMVRWLPGRSASRQLPLVDWRYLAASYPNHPEYDVTLDIEYFTTTLAQRGIRAVAVAPTYDGFLETVQRADFDVLHIACHGDAKEDNIEKAEILITDELVKGRAQFVAVSANVFGKAANLVQRRPLVFLNACEAGRLGASLTTWGGWPQRLIAAGAGAVVAASWPVRDVASNRFATGFYDALIAGKPLSSAATDARKASATGDATWMAFKVFGDPHARR